MKRLASFVISMLSALICGLVLASTENWYLTGACSALMLLNFADGYWRLGVKETEK